MSTSAKPSNGTRGDLFSPPPRRRTVPKPPLLTTTDLLIVSIYPSTLLLAFLFTLLSPSSSAPSYFSLKHNLLNVIFVKYGWLWTTDAFLVHLQRTSAANSRPQAALRYAAATVWWILVTQWCFGAPIMDRAFLVTGGECVFAAQHPEQLGSAELVATSAACRLKGGHWAGGHDLSGHVFMLTHASLFLWAEWGPWIKARGVQRGWENIVVGVVLAVWWWMLLMTGVYFHTWREKVTGLVVALMEWGVVYVWALKTQPKMIEVLGRPGI